MGLLGPDAKQIATRFAAGINAYIAWLKDNPGDWITFDYRGRRYEQVRAHSYPFPQPTFLERKLLIFKPVDFDRPKVCTH